MADLGNTTIGASGNGTFETYAIIIPATMPEDGEFTSITAYLGEDTSNNAHTVKGVLYDASFNVIGETNTRTDLTTTQGWFQLTFASPVAVSASASIYIAVAAGGGDGNIQCAYDTGASGVGYFELQSSFPTINDPGSFSSDTRGWSIYGTYDETGASVGLGPVIRQNYRNMGYS